MMDKNLQSYEQRFTSWTDDVPSCVDSGVGSSCNEVYRKDGRRVALHEYEDRAFRFRREEYSLCLYGVLDGFSGANVSDYINSTLPAELLLGQLMPEITDDQLKDLVKQAFVSLDKEYFGSIGEKLAARMVMRVEGEQSNSARLKELEQLVSSGCSATIAVVLENRLFVSNIGDCQAFLCYQTEVEDDLRISTLSIDHNLSNEDESLRLQHLGYDPLQDEAADTGLGSQNYTRCFGNYLVKGGYKENERLATCLDDPVIAEPEIQGPIQITEDLELLVIATKSLCEAVESCYEGERGTTQAQLARLLRHHLAAEPCSSLSTVAQSTLDHIVRMFTEREQVKSNSIIQREDMTLLVRCFKSRRQGEERRTSSPGYQSDSQSIRRREEKTLTRSSARPRPTRSSTTTESSGLYMAHGSELPVDEHGRIQPYVDFGPFYKLWNARLENGDSQSHPQNNVS